MKKTYAKPSIYVEEFTLSEHVAAGCTTMNNDLYGWIFAGHDDKKTFTNGNECVYEDLWGIRYFRAASCEVDSDDYVGCEQAYDDSLKYFFS